MAPTVFQVEQELIRRCGGLMAMAGFLVDGVTTPNPDLASAIARAARECGLAPANPFGVEDVELASLAYGDLDRFMDVAELRQLQNCFLNYVDFDTNINQGYEQKADQIRQALEKAIAMLTKKVADLYGIGIFAEDTYVGQPCLNYPVPGTPGFGLGWGRTDH